MGQTLHGSARTTEAFRRAIQHSQESLRALAKGLAAHPVRAAQVRISTFASQLVPRRSNSAALALAPSNQAEWEEF